MAPIGWWRVWLPRLVSAHKVTPLRDACQGFAIDQDAAGHRVQLQVIPGAARAEDEGHGKEQPGGAVGKDHGHDPSFFPVPVPRGEGEVCSSSPRLLSDALARAPLDNYPRKKKEKPPGPPRIESAQSKKSNERNELSNQVLK